MLHQLIDEMTVLVDGIIENPGFQDKYRTDEDFREYVTTVSRLYKECRDEVGASYGKGGVRTYNNALRSRFERLDNLILDNALDEVGA